MNAPDAKRYYVADLAREIGKSAQTIKRWLKAGKIRIGRIKKEVATGKLVFTEEQAQAIRNYARALKDAY